MARHDALPLLDPSCQRRLSSVVVKGLSRYSTYAAGHLESTILVGLGNASAEDVQPRTPSLEQQMSLIQRQLARLEQDDSADPNERC
jgi:hypothetical protein